MKIFMPLALSLAEASFKASDYPNHQFSGCAKANGVTTCKKISCKYFTKMKVTKATIDGSVEDLIQCPSLSESGCETKWGYTYAQGKKATFDQSTHALVPPNGIKHSSKTGAMTITCNMSGAQTAKVKCLPKYGNNFTSVTFEWNKVHPACEGKGEGWAQWESWSGVGGNKCEPQTATRSRQCLDGPHPGKPTPCSSTPAAGASNESRIVWPQVCGKCHADLGMMHTEKNIPSLKLPHVLKDHIEDKYDDGFVPVGQGISKLKCHDQASYVKPYKQNCICDELGCRFKDAPLCYGSQYKGYGTDYMWMPGAKDTFKNEDTNPFTTVTVEDDFSITYTSSKDPDQRFENRVAWWPNGPSICRYWTKSAYLPGIERPIHFNDDGSLDFDFYNWLECDNYVYNVPKLGANANTGAKYYEVLTSDNELNWVKANTISESDIEDKMVVMGTSSTLDKIFMGLCRTSSCTVKPSIGGSCASKVINKNSRKMFENTDFYPGVLHWSNKDNQWKCQNLLVTEDTTQSLQYNKFEVLLKN